MANSSGRFGVVPGRLCWVLQPADQYNCRENFNVDIIKLAEPESTLESFNVCVVIYYQLIFTSAINKP